MSGVGDAEVVDGVAEGGAVQLVDGIDDFVLRDCEMVGEHENGEVEVEIGFLLFDIVGELSREECHVAVAATRGVADTFAKVFGAHGEAEGVVANEEHDDALNDAAGNDEHEGTRGVKWEEDVADADTDAVGGNGEVNHAEVGMTYVVGGVVFVQLAVEARDVANAVVGHIGDLSEDNEPIKVIVNGYDEVVAPAAVEEAMRDTFGAALNP